MKFKSILIAHYSHHLFKLRNFNNMRCIITTDAKKLQTITIKNENENNCSYYSNKGSNKYLADKKYEKFGHGLVFKEVENMLMDKCILCQAFPIGLVLPDDQKEDTDAFMKTHLNDENFKGEIQVIFDNFIRKVNETIHSEVT